MHASNNIYPALSWRDINRIYRDNVRLHYCSVYLSSVLLLGKLGKNIQNFITTSRIYLGSDAKLVWFLRWSPYLLKSQTHLSTNNNHTSESSHELRGASMTARWSDTQYLINYFHVVHFVMLTTLYQDNKDVACCETWYERHTDMWLLIRCYVICISASHQFQSSSRLSSWTLVSE